MVNVIKICFWVGVFYGDEVIVLFNYVNENNFVILVVNVVGINFVNVVLEIVCEVNFLVIVQFFNGGFSFFVGKGMFGEG